MIILVIFFLVILYLLNSKKTHYNFKKFFLPKNVIQNSIGSNNIIQHNNKFNQYKSPLTSGSNHIIFKHYYVIFNLYLLRGTTPKDIINNIDSKNNIFSCIPDLMEIDNKLLLWKKLVQKYGIQKSKNIMPNTFLIPEDLNRFKQEYKNQQKYILKKLYRGGKSGVTIFDSYDSIINEFNKGKQINKYNESDYLSSNWKQLPFHLVQEFKSKPYLINNYKTNLRFYLVAIYSNGSLNFYLHNDAIITYSGIKYNKNNIDRKSGITSLHDNFLLSDKYKYELGMPYFLSQISIHKKIIEKLKYICDHVINSYQFNIDYNHQMFQIFGGDAEIDSNLDVCLYEFNNYTVAIDYYSDSRYIIIQNLINNIFYKLNLSHNKYDDFILLNTDS